MDQAGWGFTNILLYSKQFYGTLILKFAGSDVTITADRGFNERLTLIELVMANENIDILRFLLVEQNIHLNISDGNPIRGALIWL